MPIPEPLLRPRIGMLEVRRNNCLCHWTKWQIHSGECRQCQDAPGCEQGHAIWEEYELAFEQFSKEYWER